MFKIDLYCININFNGLYVFYIVRIFELLYNLNAINKQRVLRMKYILLISFFIIIGCKSEKVSQPLVVEDLVGEWDIFHVTRNGKVTKTLENGYLHFQADNTIKSNLFSDEKNHTFILKQDKVDVDGLENLNEFKIESLSNDTLIVTSKVNVFDMQFYLKKK